MKLFAYGCSFTYGSELADIDFSGLSVNETDDIKNKIGQTEFYNRYVRNKSEKKYVEIMHEKSYAKTIADVINADDYVNRAAPGGSNMHMFYNILDDIEKGKVTEEDIIFVGYTSFSRYVWWDKDLSKFRSTTVAGGPWPNAKFQKQYTLNVSDQDYILQNVQAYYAIKEITKEFKFFYQTTQWPYTHTYGHAEIDNSLFKSLEEIDRNALIPETCIFYEMPDYSNWRNYSHAFGHPYKEYHESYGKKLGEALNEKIKFL